MAFGTGFMAITFWLIGSKIWVLGKKFDLVTPSDLIHHIYRNRFLSILFAMVMIVFTVPYLAIQPMAGGLVFEELFGIPKVWGAVIITGVILIYTLRGGLKAIAWTDVFQGLLMLVLMTAALIIVANHFGGLSAAFERVRSMSPELFSRPGAKGAYTPGIWFSWMLLWFFCDPMFPQLFQRFYAGRNPGSLARTMLAYPAICTVVFFLPISIGILGHLYVSSGNAVDNPEKILPILMTSIGGPFMGTLILAGGLAALMSTMDSQLLTVSSIFTRDIYPLFSHKREAPAISGRIFIVVIALCGLALAVLSQSTMLEIVKHAFTGLAVLMPSVLFGLYWKNPRVESAISSILAGQALVVAYAIFPESTPAFGFLPAVPIILVSVGVFLGVQIIIEKLPDLSIKPVSLTYGIIFTVIFILAMDFWNWGKSGPFVFGLPYWTWYFIGLSLIQTVAMVFWLHKNKLMKAVEE
jgi:SSS family solute:Na+ symporter